MQTYANFQPTGFDRRGLGLPNRQDWIVCPVIQTRDSGTLEASNFAAALRILGDESDTVEVHRFGHWGPGWYEIILVHPDRENEVADLESSLEDYCVLDDDDLSEREHNEYLESWERWGASEFIDALKDAFKLSYDTAWNMREIDNDKLMELYEGAVSSGDYYCEGYGFRFDIACRNIERSQLASFIRRNRPRKVAA